MPAKSSRKGGAYERECGRTLSGWMTRGEDVSQLIRSVQSGGWSRRGERQAGDLAANGPRGDEFRSVFGVECKRREDFEWRHLWTSEAPALIAWWEKHAAECADLGLVPMLMYKRNYHQELVGVPEGLIPRAHLPAVSKVVEYGPHRIRFFAVEHLTSLDPDEVLGWGRAFLGT